MGILPFIIGASLLAAFDLGSLFYVLRTAEAGHHPALVRVEEVAVGRADVKLRRGERAAPKHFLIDEPLVVVFIELGLESGIGDIIRSRPFPSVANHLVTAISILPLGKRANGRGTPEAVLKQISFR